MVLMSNTLLNRIEEMSNDYSGQEIKFLKSTGLHLVTPEEDKADFECDTLVSVIIPCYNDCKTLPLVIEQLNRQTYKNFEVIIVDDGSNEDVLAVVSTVKTNFGVIFIRQSKNHGSAYTRNTGIQKANGQILLFVDADILFDADFIKRFAVRCDSTDNCVLVGFKEQMPNEAFRNGRKAKYTADWRYTVSANDGFAYTYPHAISEKAHNKQYKLLNETENFKKFGNGKKIAYWSLPAMVIGHGICVTKKSALEVGGFPETGFSGWGAEDIAFGARLISAGNYIVPVLNNAYFHITHQPRSGSLNKQADELRNNLKSYFKEITLSRTYPEMAERHLKPIMVSDTLKVYKD